jgi:PKD repeat protein
MKPATLRAAIVLAVVAMAVGLPAVAQAATPSNDYFANATTIDPSSLPFSDSVTIDEANLEAGEPSGCYIAGKSVWYNITPTSSGTLRADISGSSFFDRILYVYRQDGTGFSGLSTVACASPYYNGRSSATFSVQAGKTYYVQAGGFYGFSTGTLDLALQAVLPPVNDNFANATPISSLPFQNDVDTTAATVETGEPSLCTPPPSEQTAWYAYIPASSGSVTANVTIAPAPTGIAVYTGSSLAGLTQLGCHYGFPLTIHVDAGTTYYLQIGTFGQQGGQLRFVIDVAPPPVANFSFSPGDPSIFDGLQFYNYSYDPANAGFSSVSWSFGDGSSATGCCATHKYAKDGDYTVELDVTTTDGRTASTTQAVHVKTHDVTIAKLLVPQTARSGQTKTITVGLTDSRYPETVQLQLLRSVPGGGFQQVGQLTQSVPVRGANRTTDFSINYTFTSDDASLGKVTFEAIATIQNARDALPSDNTVIALPTTVTR